MSIDAHPSPGEKVHRTLMSIDLSVGGDRLMLTCSRSGDRELQGPVSRRRGDCGGQAPALRGRSISLYTVGRGPVPRQRRTHRKRIETRRALLQFSLDILPQPTATHTHPARNRSNSSGCGRCGIQTADRVHAPPHSQHLLPRRLGGRRCPR